MSTKNISNRKNVKDIRTLAQTLSFELSELGNDLSKTLASKDNDTFDIILCLDSVFEFLKDDVCEFYQKRFKKLSHDFYKFEPIA